MRPLAYSPYTSGAYARSIFPHAGPAVYAVITYGPAAGGDEVAATEAGMKSFGVVHGGVTDSGNFLVRPIPETVSTASPNGCFSAKYRLQWVALRTAAIGGKNQTINTEAIVATDLSGETVRLEASGI